MKATYIRRLTAGMLALALAACGGGGGGGSTVPSPDEPEGVSGHVSVLSSDGSLVEAGAGVSVSLVDIDSAGTLGATLQTTRTNARGEFQVVLPAGRAYIATGGTGLAVVTPDGAGGFYRALLIGRVEAELGPDSEAVTRELYASHADLRPAATSPDRLSVFQALATLTLRLTPAGSNVPSAAVARLREWLLADPASSAAFAAFRATGTLPASIGDIGGLAGVGRSVTEYDDTPSGHHTVTTLPVAGLDGVYSLNDSSLGTEFETSRLRVENDGVTLVAQATGDNTTQILFDAIGAHKARGFVSGREVGGVLVDVQRPTTGYDFDGDNVADQVHYRIYQLSRGVETVSVFGSTLPAAKTEFQTELTLILSGGRQVKVEETRREWSLPFAGPVRIESDSVATDQNGARTTFSGTSIATRAAMNDVTWPGRLRLSAVPTTVPNGDSFTTAIAATPDLGLSIRTSVGDGTPYPDEGILWRDGKGVAAGAGVTVPSITYARTVASPDGSKIYVAVSQLPPDPVYGAVLAMDPAAAAAGSAVVVRYDARTLREEARITLPARPSALLPGLAFPRYQVLQLIVSPLDPKDFVVSGIDVLVVRDTTPLPRVIDPVSPEFIGSDGKAHLGGFIPLRVWDGTANEIWMQTSGPKIKIVPVSADGLRAGTLREGIPTFFAGGPPSDAPYDRITTDRIYADGYKTVVDKMTGTVIRRLSDRMDTTINFSRCDLRASTVYCYGGDAFLRFDRDLNEIARVPLAFDLRTRIKGPTPLSIDGGVFVPADGTMVWLSGSAEAGRASIFRLDFP